MSERIIQDVSALREQSAGIDIYDRSKVINNLVWVYQVIVASEPLLELAIQKSEGALRDYYARHIEEERNHAEWLASDLATVGINVAALPLYRSAVELAGAQYYFLMHDSPASLLGYMAVLEGFPTAIEVVEELEELHGKGLFGCLRYHAENDPEHRKELFAVIDKLDEPRAYENAIRTQYLINEVSHAYGQ